MDGQVQHVRVVGAERDDLSRVGALEFDNRHGSNAAKHTDVAGHFHHWVAQMPPCLHFLGIQLGQVILFFDRRAHRRLHLQHGIASMVVRGTTTHLGRRFGDPSLLGLVHLRLQRGLQRVQLGLQRCNLLHVGCFTGFQLLGPTGALRRLRTTLGRVESCREAYKPHAGPLATASPSQPG
ncbi:hypothetical protein H310_11658 [Aphanomyces invadans]|uniref:Uncharacterized protein n=1 Tax=Aphanomyces invadans TaxID=157072 RepID=A0A024TMS6_9STRA|nr:hypothetical protein H310_11658 [Aphanomyces invadans]ETV94672.1 hypothetical protein H310_11658 [Aphanomyces invadans]|eukprot:XP_008876617.1 hypothetical protein H310_11658 [Aphanomyces invadans]